MEDNIIKHSFINYSYSTGFNPVLLNDFFKKMSDSGRFPKLPHTSELGDPNYSTNWLPEVQVVVMSNIISYITEYMSLLKDPEAVLWHFFLSPAWADKASSSRPKDIRQWIVPAEGIDEYLGRVREVLTQSVEPFLISERIPEVYRKTFSLMVPAVAWQESCFRQFIEKRGRITYLRSYNGTSVGLMQIHERVWRGIYDLKKLRWNIRYNAAAGCEIITLYMTQYALSNWNSSSPMDADILTQAVYAMYNGGPEQYDKYMRRLKSDQLYASDKLFQEKMGWVKNNSWQSINQCLTGPS